MSSSVQQLHAQRTLEARQRHAGLAARSALLSNLRGIAFAVFVVAGLAAWWLGQEQRWAALALSTLGLLGFVALVLYHARVLRAEEHAQRRVKVSELAELRLSEAWRQLPDDGTELTSSEGFADDLDLFGPGSLFQRLTLARTRYGRRRLAALLVQASSVEEARERQLAVGALAPELEYRQELEALGLELAVKPGGAPAPPPDPEPLLAWAEGPARLSTRPWLGPLTWVLPAANLASLMAAQWGLVQGWVALLPLVASAGVVLSVRQYTSSVFETVSAGHGAFQRYARMLEVVERCPAEAPLLRRLRERVMSGSQRPSVAMRRFETALGTFELRHNGLVYPLINTLLLWDLHCTLRLERWQREAGGALRGWFEVLGEMEALTSLAGLAHDEPSFVFPELHEGPPLLVAEELAHPLLSATTRRANSISLERQGTAWLITGSNMSGKSTFLRSLGLAVVLAQAGGPVCARRMSLGHVRLVTSLRVRDSLSSGVSHFYAEVEKLKAALDATAGEVPVLFLLDEILHGTNSRERQIGARWTLARLLERGATGVITTHDMGLCQLTPPLMDRVTQAHFRETVVEGTMSFDYVLRPGPVEGGNALRLMQLVGLDVPLEEPEP